MQIVYKKPEELKDYSNNPRRNEDAIGPVADSIRQFGFLVPILIDQNNEIVTGHTRKQAAILLNMSEVPCIYADGLNENQIRAFRIVDNKTSEFASWDFDKLQEELEEIEGMIDIDLSEFHFPDLSGELGVSDEDFLQDTEIVKDKKAKCIKCPECGTEINL